MFLPSVVSLPNTDTVTQASPYYLSGMVDSYEDLTRFTRYIPGVRHGPAARCLIMGVTVTLSANMQGNRAGPEPH